MSVAEAKALGERPRCPLKNCHGRVRLHPSQAENIPPDYEALPEVHRLSKLLPLRWTDSQDPDALK